MRFEELPGIPENWIEFTENLHSRFSGLPAAGQMETLAASMNIAKDPVAGSEIVRHSLNDSYEWSPAQTRENIRQLQQSETAVVATSNYASLFGGPVCQMLKCLTAIKICEALAERAIPAVPVCWIRTAPSWSCRQYSVNLLDQNAELHNLQIPPPKGGQFSPADPLPKDSISAFISRIEDLGRGSFDTEIIEILRNAYSGSATISSASARLLTDLMSEWGMVVLDSQEPVLASAVAKALEPMRHHIAGYQYITENRESKPTKAGRSAESTLNDLPSPLPHSLVLPVIANVIDFDELRMLANVLPILTEYGFRPPTAWPGASATIIDPRSRRTLGKYHLNLNELFSGEEEAVRKITEEMPNSAVEKLENFKLEVERQMAALDALFPSGDEFANLKNSCQERIMYQIRKLRDRFESASTRRKQAVRQQVRRACNSLAPNGRLQETELSAIGFLLRYSRSMLHFLHDNLDIMKFEHQLIWTD